MKDYIVSTTLEEIFTEYPFAEDFFISIGINKSNTYHKIRDFLDNLSDDELEDCGMDRGQILSNFILFMEKMRELKAKSTITLKELKIIGGFDKTEKKENIELVMKPGEIVCIVGQTGAGKSRLLADIECLAQKDTPTKRMVILNGEAPSQEKRFSLEHKLVAQLSQNMNFIMDLSVEEFITMHAESRMLEDIEGIVSNVFNCANDLAGEKFNLDTPVTGLSGGQSRALMIADTALLSSSPIVLIDEIENAGVDRKKALELLVQKEKIVLMSTHDPILALMGHKRIVIQNGGMSKVIETSEEEKGNLEFLKYLDGKMLELRNMLRNGEKIDFDTKKFIGIWERVV